MHRIITNLGYEDGRQSEPSRQVLQLDENSPLSAFHPFPAMSLAPSHACPALSPIPLAPLFNARHVAFPAALLPSQAWLPTSFAPSHASLAPRRLYIAPTFTHRHSPAYKSTQRRYSDNLFQYGVWRYNCYDARTFSQPPRSGQNPKEIRWFRSVKGVDPQRTTALPFCDISRRGLEAKTCMMVLQFKLRKIH